MPTNEILPLTVWEQLPVVASMFLLMLIMFFWILKSRKEDQEFQAKQQQFNAEQQKEWQDFIAGQDDKWRQFNKEQRAENTDAQKCVEVSMQGLTIVIQDLVNESREMRKDSKEFYASFHRHDAQAKEILDKVINGNAKPAPATRAKKTTITKE